MSPFHGVSSGEEVEEQLAVNQEGAESRRPESAAGLIHAEELPRAADVLAELFPEEAPEGEVESARASQDQAGQEEARPPIPEPQPQLKRRGIFSRLFRSRDFDEERTTAQTPVQSPASDSAASKISPTRESQGNPGSTTAVNVIMEDEADEKASTADDSPAPISALPRIFPAEQATVHPPVATASIGDHQTEPVHPIQARDEARSETAGDTTAKERFRPEEPLQAQDLGRGAPSELERSSGPAEPFALAKGEVRAEKMESSAAHGEASQGQSSDPAQAEEPRRGPYRDWALDDKLASHREWIESHGRTGNRADLSGAELEGADLISVNLRLADLHDGNLRAADMLLADLRDACLVRADLEESCLVGANLEGANLEGATLETAMGLVPRQLAGANLRDALLAPQLMEFEAATKFARNARLAYRYFCAMTAVSLISWLLIGKTSDMQLVSDSSVLPFLHSHAAASALPMAESYLIMPVALFICYLVFHFHLQQLWEAVQELPAIFPDGHELGDDQPSIIIGLARTHFRWMNPDLSSTRVVERALALLLAYGLVPITLLLFWARYLTRQEIHGTILQGALAAVATGIAIYACTKVGRLQERWEFEGKWSRQLAAKVRAINPVKAAAILGGALLFLSAGTIVGVPHDKARAPQYSLASIRRWAPNIFASLGYDPYADLTEKSLSRGPSPWNVPDDQVQSVDGARLNGAKLRYAQAYGIFLANAHMLHSDLQGAFLSQADLREADLGQSNLRYAVMDQARMRGVNLDRSNLTGADLRRADLSGANLSHCKLESAILGDARLDGASLYGSHLDRATLNRANLEKTDMREAFLTGAHLDHADLQGAYLWSAVLNGADLGGAKFGGAILIDANLQGANLGGAQLGAAVLNGTNLGDTSLEGADLRGALGLTAAQVCGAKSRRGALMDDVLAMEVQAQCGLR